MSKRLLAILSRYLWPVDSGRKESLTHYFQALHDQYGYEIRLLCFLESGQSVESENLPPYIMDAEALADTPPLEIAGNLLFQSFGKENWPTQCSLYYSRQNMVHIREIVSTWKPDVIFTEMIRTCMYYEALRGSGALLLANLDDLLSLRYQRQARSGKSKANFTGNYAGKLPSPLAAFLNSTALKQVILNLEAKRCEIWEHKFYELYDYTLMTSDVERDTLNRVMKGEKAKTLSVGVDYAYYSAQIEAERETGGLSYVGNLYVAANADTLEMIVKQILPLIKSDYRYFIIGNCPDAIRKKYQDNNRLIFLGRVDDLREAVKKTSVFLSPMAYGSGIKTKIVEAMAMQMPVVTNSVGAEGIWAEPERDYIIRDNPEEIADAVDKLLLSPTLAASIGENAGRFAEKHFNWDQVLSVFQEIGL